MLLVLSGFFLIGRQFVTLWVGDEYKISYYATLILMLAGYIPAIQTLGVNIQNAKNMHRTRSVVYFIVACMNVMASIYFIKLWGVVGTCLGTLLATLLGHGVFMNWYYQRKIGLNILYFWKEMFKWILPVCILTGIGMVIIQYFMIDSWVKLIVFACGYGCIYVIVLYFIGLDTAQRKNIIEKAKLAMKR